MLSDGASPANLSLHEAGALIINNVKVYVVLQAPASSVSYFQGDCCQCCSQMQLPAVD